MIQWLTNWERIIFNFASINYSQKANHLEDAIFVELAQKRLVIIPRQSKAIVQDSEQKELVSGPDSRSPHDSADD